MKPSAWYDYIKLSKIDDEDRYRILDYVVSRVRVQDALSVSRVTMWRLLSKQARIDDAKLRVLLRFLSEKEFLSSRKLLEALGVVRSDGTINYPVVMEILKLATSDEYLKQLIIGFVVDNFREDVKKAIGLFPANIEFRWGSDFENFLAREKRRKRIRRQDTIEYYKKLFKENLEGKQLTPELVDFVVKHRSKWLRNIFRHYIQYLYHKRKIPLETFGWVMEVVPARTYEGKVKIFRIDLDLLKKTIGVLEAAARALLPVLPTNVFLWDKA